MRNHRPSFLRARPRPLLLLLALAVLGAAPAAAQVPPDSSDAVFARVATDKPVYAPGEPVEIRVFAVNPAPVPVDLGFASGCLADYDVDGQYRWLDHAACTMNAPRITLAPGEERPMGRFVHTPADYELAPGSHVITGAVVGYAKAQVRIQVQDSPLPARRPFTVRGAVDPLRGALGEARALGVTVTNAGDSTASFGVDGCPVDWSIDGRYTPDRPCPDFFRRIDLEPGESITFGPGDPGMTFDPHDYPVGPGRHLAVLAVRGVGADSVVFGVAEPDPSLTYLAGRILFADGLPAPPARVVLTTPAPGSDPSTGPPPDVETQATRLGRAGLVPLRGHPSRDLLPPGRVPGLLRRPHRRRHPDPHRVVAGHRGSLPGPAAGPPGR